MCIAASQKDNLPYDVKEKHTLEQDNTVVVKKDKFLTKLNKEFNKERKNLKLLLRASKQD